MAHLGIGMLFPSATTSLFFQFGTALAIIGEHSFYLWDQARKGGAKHLISAIEAYKSSAKHAAVMLAVDTIFEEDEGRLLKEAKARLLPSDSAFATQLVQIALDNRLRTCWLFGIQVDI
jgi:hypothetical protein